MKRAAKTAQAIQSLHQRDAGSGEGRAEERALSCLLITLLYMVTVVSFPKYQLAGLCSMVIYLLIQAIWHELSLWEGLKKLWPVCLLTAVMGAANPFFDRVSWGQLYGLTITGGMVSMLTLMLKGIFCALASYFMACRMGIRGICRGLRLLHVPRELVTVLLLMDRYLLVLLKEVERMTQAYRLRAPGQKGIHIRAWGAFLGLLLLRSLDRAQVVYESMLLRGYKGEFDVGFYGKNGLPDNGRGTAWAGVLVFLAWAAAFLTLRFVPVFQLAGRLL